LETVEDAHLVAALQQEVRNVGADEAGSPRHQGLHALPSRSLPVAHRCNPAPTARRRPRSNSRASTPVRAVGRPAGTGSRARVVTLSRTQESGSCALHPGAGPAASPDQRSKEGSGSEGALTGNAATAMPGGNTGPPGGPPAGPVVAGTRSDPRRVIPQTTRPHTSATRV